MRGKKLTVSCGASHEVFCYTFQIKNGQFTHVCHLKNGITKCYKTHTANEKFKVHVHNLIKCELKVQVVEEVVCFVHPRENEFELGGTTTRMVGQFKIFLL